MERIVSDEDIDESLEEWVDLGFSKESLEILRRRLYGKIISYDFLVEIPFFDGSYGWFDTQRNAHIIESKEEKFRKGSWYHEIRHCFSAEIFRILLDTKSEMYGGLTEEQKNERSLEVYDTVRPLIHSKKIGFAARIRAIPKKEREGLESLKQINPPDKHGVLDAVRKNKELYARTLDYIFAYKNMSLSENICMTTEEVNKASLDNKIMLSLISAMAAAYAYGWTIVGMNKSNSSHLLYASMACIPLTCMLYFGIFRHYGNKKVIEKLRNRLSTNQEPYEQFLTFVDSH